MGMYFYKNAHTLRYDWVYWRCYWAVSEPSGRPNDGRFLRALSECYLELNRVDEAKKVRVFVMANWYIEMYFSYYMTYTHMYQSKNVLEGIPNMDNILYLVA